jgi:hypothetical protein
MPMDDPLGHNGASGEILWTWRGGAVVEYTANV